MGVEVFAAQDFVVVHVGGPLQPVQRSLSDDRGSAAPRPVSTLRLGGSAAVGRRASRRRREDEHRRRGVAETAARRVVKTIALPVTSHRAPVSVYVLCVRGQQNSADGQLVRSNDTSNVSRK